MKHIVLLGDGMADFPMEALGGRTPLEAAFTPSMDDVALSGASGLFYPVPGDLPPGSDVGNLSVFGYDPHEALTGRAPFEAANHGIRLAPSQIAFRCNFVTLDGGVMKDFTAGHISTPEANQLIVALNAALHHLPVIFSTGVSYRHIAIITPSDDLAPHLDSAQCTPPHDIIGEPYAEHPPAGTDPSLLLELMEAARPVLAEHSVNAARIASGKLPATDIWLWGQGRSPHMKTYKERFGIGGSVISAVDLVKGIGICAGLDAIHIPGATGYLDTDYAAKVKAALDGVRLKDFVYVHIEAPDEASHEGRLDLKIRAIEDLDARVVAPCLEFMRKRRETRLVVAPDHVTAISTRTHAHGPVPFVVCGPGVEPDGAAIFSERAAKDTGSVIQRAHTLLPHMLESDSIDLAALTRSGDECENTPEPGSEPGEGEPQCPAESTSAT